MGKALQLVPPGRRVVTSPGCGLLVVILVIACGSVRGGRAADTASPADTSLSCTETEFHLLDSATASVTLSHAFVAPESFRAVVDGQLWLPDTDYRLRAREGTWIPLQRLGAGPGGQSLVVLTYRFRPVPIPPRQDLHPIVTRPAAQDTTTADSLTAASGYEDASPGAGLNIRGSKSVRVASGSRRELTVDQTLRLTIAGQLTDDIAVKAALSDDNLPVVPEGNTEELRDIDRVLVELQAPHWQATLGDFVAQRSGTVFGNYRRKLQGATLVVSPEGVEVDALAGAPRGIYRTVQIRGQEANQGPYRLGAGATGGSLFIVAGSEKVTLDGEMLTRGLDRDYIIDYVQGTLTFTYRRLITAESTIVIEFEEGEGPFVRTVVGGGAKVDFRLPVGEALSGGLGVRLLREKDDPERLRTGELSEADLAALRAAGDDPELAVARGVFAVEPGQGRYRLEVVDGDTLYSYDPLSGDFEVDFFFVGSAQGDYGVDSLTVAGERVFSYRGSGAGSYRIGRPLPLPSSHSLMSVTSHLGSAEQPYLTGEWNLSVLDRNAFSPVADQDNGGTAWVVQGDSGERELFWRGRSLGDVQLQGRHEYRNERFRPLLLRRNLFSYDRWGLGARAQRDGWLNERDMESQLGASWSAGTERRRLKMSMEWGRLEHGPSLTANRLSARSAWRWRGGQGQSQWERANGQDTIDPLDIERDSYRHRASWDCRAVRPSAFIEQDSWQDAAAAAQAAGGYRLRRWGYGLGALPQRRWQWELSWERGLADSLRSDAWQRERDSQTGRVELTTPQIAGMRAVVDATVREIEGPGDLTQTTRLVRFDLGGRWQSVGSDWSLGYRVDSSRSEVQDRQVVFVGERQGDYNEAGDFVGRNQGDFNVILAGTDSLVATTTVEADLLWRQDFGFFGKRRIWGAWSTLTQLAVRGRSRTDDVGRLLRLEPDALFDPDEAVLGEVDLRQEITLLRHLRWLDLRLRYDFAEARDRQFLAHPEDRLNRTYQATATWNYTEKSSLRLRTEQKQEQRLAIAGAIGSRRSYDTASTDYEAEWALRPTPGNRVTLAVEAIDRSDDVSGVKQTELALRPAARYRIRKRWSGQVELRWAEVTSEEPAGRLRPFFFSVPGSNLEASARLGWDPTDQLSMALVYFGRRSGERGWQHDVRMESTARF